MAIVSADELKQHLEQALPGALAPAPREPASHGAPKKGERAPADLLATNDALVHATRLPEVAAYVRDTLGYELLSNITAVDYLADGVIELVYHFFHLQGGPALVLKVRLPRDEPRTPSLAPDWPGAELQEREAFDLFGVLFDGHPNLRRVYMWDEFEGFPMRKDYARQGDKYFADQEEF